MSLWSCTTYAYKVRSSVMLENAVLDSLVSRLPDSDKSTTSRGISDGGLLHP